MDILIIDDHPVFASGLKELISSAFSDLDVQICTNLHDARNLLSQASCRLALLDLDLCGYSSLGHISSLVALPNLQSLCVLSASENASQIQETLLSGASGYISKNYSPELVLAAIKSVLEGGVFMPKEVFEPFRVIFKSAEKEVDCGDMTGLTERQKEVVSLICRGMSNKQIAMQLGISEGTTKLHVSNILSLMKASKRSELIVRLSKSA